jgi:hypothetical protein
VAAAAVAAHPLLTPTAAILLALAAVAAGVDVQVRPPHLVELAELQAVASQRPMGFPATQVQLLLQVPEGLPEPPQWAVYIRPQAVLVALVALTELLEALVEQVAVLEAMGLLAELAELLVKLFLATQTSLILQQEQGWGQSYDRHYLYL